MKRSEATRRLEQLLRNAAGGGRYVSRIREIWVFGSYARGAAEVGDIDLDVEYEHDDALGIELVQALSYGRDPHAGLNRELRGAQRIFQIHYGHAAGPRAAHPAPAAKPGQRTGPAGNARGRTRRADRRAASERAHGAAGRIALGRDEPEAAGRPRRRRLPRAAGDRSAPPAPARRARARRPRATGRRRPRRRWTRRRRRAPRRRRQPLARGRQPEPDRATRGGRAAPGGTAQGCFSIIGSSAASGTWRFRASPLPL